jgi:predicted transport protein
MGDIKLFKLAGRTTIQLQARSMAIEKSLQSLIEVNLEAFLGVRLIASEYSTGRTHRGRIDTLGIDENGCPVIIEYKRALQENVINQGLFYLDWLLDHKAEFKLLVLERCGQTQAEEIEWSTPRLVCIAGDFTRYDEHAVQQIDRNIELIRYRRFGSDLLLFELVNLTTAVSEGRAATEPAASRGVVPRQMTETLASATADLADLYEGLRAFVTALGDDVQVKILKFYVAYKRIQNFACVEIHTQARKLSVFVKVDPDSVVLQPGFTRNVRNIGHLGTGDLEITIASPADLERAKPLIVQSYEQS